MNLSGRGIDAEVDDLEARAAQHHDAEVLADVVQVALDRAHDTLAIGSMPEAERIGSMCAMPAFMARAQASTSGRR